ncbi:caspase family protein [Nodosilinea sp. LEGE 07088]|nr:caspase family protein [Nodosilinea sp. LEGE 07088]
MKRRHFLQAAGASLATLGLSQTNWLRQADRYGQALAQSNPRKLALLIGVNQYTDPNIPDLNGCLTDVEMQYQLLVNRFGFNSADVLQVTDDSGLLPTRANILQAFEEHIIQQAQPGDVVVIHYSGHGSRVLDPNPIVVSQCGANSNPNGLNGTLVPRDAGFFSSGNDIAVSDIMGRSLFLLMERVNTDHLTVVLDSCFSGGGTRGNARVRAATSSRLSAARSGGFLLPIVAELEQQKRWQQSLNLDEAEFQRRRAQGIAKGVTLGSASCDQEAYEIPYDTNAAAGAFTYLLTSYLWQLPAAEAASTVQVNLVRSTKISTQNRGTQVPIFETAPGVDNLAQPLYFTDALAPFAEGVVRTVEGEQLEFWLGGMSDQTLKTAVPGTVYTLLDPTSGDALGDVALVSRNGLLAYGKLLEGSSAAVRPGLLLREKIAAIASPTLKIGVDPSLSAEQDAAETALSTVLSSGTTNRITVLPVNQQSAVEYVLARTSEETQLRLGQSGVAELPPIGAIGLYSADLNNLVAGSAGPVGETAAAAVNRLQPRLRSLLVAQVLKELASTASDLRVGGEIYTSSGRGPKIPLLSRGNLAGQGRIRTELTGATYQTDELINIKITNEEANPVYLSCLVIDSSGNIITLHPARWDAPEEAARIDSGESLVVPRNEDGVQFRVSGAGFLEVLTLVSRQQLRGLLRNLQTIARSANRSRGMVGFSEGDPLSLINDLLGDVDGISRSGATIQTETVGAQYTAVDSGAIAAFSTILEIV